MTVARRSAYVLLGLLIFNVSWSTPSDGNDQHAAAELLPSQILKFSPATNFSGNVYIDSNSRNAAYQKVAVLPFKNTAGQSGVYISDLFASELLKTAKYELIDRSQVERVLSKNDFCRSGIIKDKMAAQLGKILGVQGVVVGVVSDSPSIERSVRMIDSITGKIVWSVSHSVVEKSGTSPSLHAKDMVEQMVAALCRAWIDTGDVKTAGILPVSSASSTGMFRKVAISWTPDISDMVAGYEISRKNPYSEDYFPFIRLEKNRQGRMSYEDKGLQDFTLYSYEIRTISKYGLLSAEAVHTEAITAGLPDTPNNLVAESGRIRQVPLMWDPPSDQTVTGYIILRQKPDHSLEQVARLTDRKTASYVDKGDKRNPLGDGQTCIYRIKAFNEAGVESEPSSPVKATTRQSHDLSYPRRD